MPFIRSLILVLVGALLGFALFWLEYPQPKEAPQAPSLRVSRTSYSVVPFQGYDSTIFSSVEHELEVRLQELVGYKNSRAYYIAAAPTGTGFDLVVCASDTAPALDDKVLEELFQLARERVNHYAERRRPAWHTSGLE